MTCSVCGAPPLPLHGACVFCRAPMSEAADPGGLLDYLAAHLPGAQARRAGLRRRGPVRELRYGRFRGRLRRERLELTPDGDEVEWVDVLLEELSKEAASNPEARQAMARSGWDFR